MRISYLQRLTAIYFNCGFAAHTHSTTIMPLRSRHLLREEITFSVAQDKELNILHQLGYYDIRENSSLIVSIIRVT